MRNDKNKFIGSENDDAWQPNGPDPIPPPAFVVTLGG